MSSIPRDVLGRVPAEYRASFEALAEKIASYCGEEGSVAIGYVTEDDVLQPGDLVPELVLRLTTHEGDEA